MKRRSTLRVPRPIIGDQVTLRACSSHCLRRLTITPAEITATAATATPPITSIELSPVWGNPESGFCVEPCPGFSPGFSDGASFFENFATSVRSLVTGVSNEYSSPLRYQP